MRKKDQEYVDAIKTTLQQGGDLNTVDEEGYTPLMRVIAIIPELLVNDSVNNAEEHESVVDLCIQMMDKGASIQGDVGVRCLCLAIESKRLSQELIRRGVPINGKQIESLPPEACFPIVSAAGESRKLELFKWYREQGAELSPSRSADCLIYAMNCSMMNHFKIELIENLLKLGVDPNHPNEKGEYPISIAADNGTQWYELLVKAGASTQHISEKQQSMLTNDKVYDAITSKDEKKAIQILQSTQSDVTLPFQQNIQLIHYAAKYGLTSVIKALLERGANPSAVAEDGDTPLHELADSDHLNIEAVQALLDGGANVNLRNEDNQTPLFCMRNFITSNHHFAIRCEFIRLMVKHGANISGEQGKDLFGKVLAANETALAELLLQNGIDASDGLVQSIEGQNWEMVEYFNKQGQKIESRAKEILDILCHQTESPQSIALAKECLAFIEDVNEVCDDETHNTYLMYCAIRNTPTIGAMLIDRGANLEQETKRGSTPLERAVAYERVEMVELLLNRGADLTSEGLMHLCTAIKDKNIPIVKLMLDKGVNPNADRKGTTPLQRAIEVKSFPMVELLLKHKADPNLKGEEGDYPLAMAIKSGNCEMIHQLLLQGADLTIKQGKKTLAEIAKASKKEGVAELCALTQANLKKYKPKKDGLVFTNKRMLFAMGVDQWSDVIKSQVKKVFGKRTMAVIKEDMDGGDIEYVDVMDAESGKGMYQLMTFPYGDGALLAWDKTTVVGNIVQHGFEVAKAMSDDKKSQLCNMLDEANKAYGGVEQGVKFVD